MPGRDWKGDPVPHNPFAMPVHVPAPPEFASKATLMAHLGVNDHELKKIRWFRQRMYHTFELAKGDGKSRQIQAPDPRLKYLQRSLLPLLEKLYRVRNPVHGFVRGKSVKTNAIAHLRRRHLLNIDLHDFFGSITENRVVGVLEAIGIASEVAATIGYICCLPGSLPQGAPTSPLLSNMVCFRLDRELLRFAKEARCIYTRYADDISLSSHQPLTAVFEGSLPSAGNFPLGMLDPELLNIIKSNGFELNPDKAHYADRNSRRMVTGLKVNELLNVDRRYVRNLRAMLYSIEQFGLTKAQAKFTALGNQGDIGLHIRGKIEWISNVKGAIDPVVRSIIVRYNACFPRKTIAISPNETERRDRSSWITENKNGQGTLFFLEGVGLVTAAHCVADLSEVEIFHPSKHANTFKTQVARIDKDRDLAVLAHSVPSTEFFELSCSTSPVAVGDAMTAIGYPSWGFGDPLNVRPGVVSALTVKSGVQLIEVNQKLSQGMSGGPILDAAGEVIGIIHKGGPTEGRDFAIHIDVLLEWLANFSP